MSHVIKEIITDGYHLNANSSLVLNDLKRVQMSGLLRKNCWVQKELQHFHVFILLVYFICACISAEALSMPNFFHKTNHV